MSAQLIENLVWQRSQRTTRVVLQPQGSPTSQNCDIFAGTDTYGWPEPESSYFCPPGISRVVTLLAQLTAVPSILGLTPPLAGIALAASNLSGALIDSIYSSVYPVGTIANQIPSSGALVNFGYTVQYELSLGPAPIVSPYITLAAAISILVNAGFVVDPNIQTQSSSIVPAGDVISQSPAPGANVPYGTKVTLLVSSGPEVFNPDVVVANYVGLDIWMAQDAAALAGLGISNVLWQTSDTVPGTIVLAQSLTVGESVAPQTPIVFTVASGPTATYAAQGGSLTVPNVQ